KNLKNDNHNRPIYRRYNSSNKMKKHYNNWISFCTFTMRDGIKCFLFSSIKYVRLKFKLQCYLLLFENKSISSRNGTGAIIFNLYSMRDITTTQSINLINQLKLMI
ncbi:MAG: hypothetical protein KDC67_06575, partial [Ignavibacteriae bacterium]|nr:hypothetical protein [Ignavibacteriota bacterium]